MSLIASALSSGFYSFRALCRPAPTESITYSETTDIEILPSKQARELAWLFQAEVMGDLLEERYDIYSFCCQYPLTYVQLAHHYVGSGTNNQLAGLFDKHSSSKKYCLLS